MKKILLFFIMMFSLTQVFSNEIFKFKEIKKIDSGYYCLIEKKSDKSSAILFLNNEEFDVFLKSFKEVSALKLIGKEFSAKWSDFDLAVDYFLVSQKTTEYTSPTESQFINKIVDLFCEMESPEKYISEVDLGTLMDLTRKMWWNGQVRDNWYYYIKSEVKRKSDGKITFSYDNELSIYDQETERFFLTKYNNNKEIIQRKVVVFQNRNPMIYFE